jgi:hypothetical protein
MKELGVASRLGLGRSVLHRSFSSVRRQNAKGMDGDGKEGAGPTSGHTATALRIDFFNSGIDNINLPGYIKLRKEIDHGYFSGPLPQLPEADEDSPDLLRGV